MAKYIARDSAGNTVKVDCKILNENAESNTYTISVGGKRTFNVPKYKVTEVGKIDEGAWDDVKAFASKVVTKAKAAIDGIAVIGGKIICKLRNLSIFSNSPANVAGLEGCYLYASDQLKRLAQSVGIGVKEADYEEDSATVTGTVNYINSFWKGVKEVKESIDDGRFSPYSNAAVAFQSMCESYGSFGINPFAPFMKLGESYDQEDPGNMTGSGDGTTEFADRYTYDQETELANFKASKLGSNYMDKITKETSTIKNVKLCYGSVSVFNEIIGVYMKRRDATDPDEIRNKVKRSLRTARNRNAFPDNKVDDIVRNIYSHNATSTNSERKLSDYYLNTPYEGIAQSLEDSGETYQTTDAIRPWLIWGAPGIGKTQIVSEVINNIRKTYSDKVSMICLDAGFLQPEDVTYPTTVRTRTKKIASAAGEHIETRINDVRKEINGKDGGLNASQVKFYSERIDPDFTMEKYQKLSAEEKRKVNDIFIDTLRTSLISQMASPDDFVETEQGTDVTELIMKKKFPVYLPVTKADVSIDSLRNFPELNDKYGNGDMTKDEALSLLVEKMNRIADNVANGGQGDPLEPDENFQQGGGGIIFVDELIRIPKRTLNSLMNFFGSRKINDFILGSRWCIVGASNRKEELSENEQDEVVFDSAQKNRWNQMCYIPKYADWRQWARRSGVHPLIIDFLDIYHDEYWYMLNEVGGEFSPSTTPRSWTQLSKRITDKEEEYYDLIYANADKLKKKISLYYSDGEKRGKLEKILAIRQEGEAEGKTEEAIEQDIQKEFPFSDFFQNKFIQNTDDLSATIDSKTAGTFSQFAKYDMVMSTDLAKKVWNESADDYMAGKTLNIPNEFKDNLGEPVNNAILRAMIARCAKYYGQANKNWNLDTEEYYDAAKIANSGNSGSYKFSGAANGIPVSGLFSIKQMLGFFVYFTQLAKMNYDEGSNPTKAGSKSNTQIIPNTISVFTALGATMSEMLKSKNVMGHINVYDTDDADYVFLGKTWNLEQIQKIIASMLSVNTSTIRKGTIFDISSWRTKNFA